MAQRRNIFTGLLYINRGENGTSESYHLAANSFEEAAATFMMVILARSYVLAAGCEIVWAWILWEVSPPQVLAILPAPIPALTLPDTSHYWQPPHVDSVALHVVLETEQGFWANRYLRFIADDETLANQWIRSGLVVPPGPILPPAAPNLATKAELWTYFLATVRDHTVHARNLQTGQFGETDWEVNPWFTVFAPAVTKRNIHRKWRIVSGEPADADWAPGFSFCGMKAGPISTTYEAPCIFYYDGLPQRIRWYDAKPEADIFPLPTIFFPYSNLLQYENLSRPGEFTGKANRERTIGTYLSDPDGDHYCGTPADFLGISSIPWDPTLPTPEEQKCECDMPLYITARLSDLSKVYTPIFTFSFSKEDGFDIENLGGNVVGVRFNNQATGLRDINSWRQTGTDPLDRAYFAGMNTNTETWDWEPDGGQIYALPLLAAAGGVIDKILCEVTDAGHADAAIRLGLYKAISQSNLYPGELLAASEDIDCSTTGVKTFDVNIALQLGTLYWLTILHNTETPKAKFAGQSTIDFYPIWGVPTSSLNTSASYGHMVGHAYGDLLDPFPAVGSAIFLEGDVMNNAPKLAVHFSGPGLTPPPPPPPPPPPVETSLVMFDGDDFLEAPNTVDLTPANFTMFCQLKYTDLPDYATILGLGYYDGAVAWNPPYVSYMLSSDSPGSTLRIGIAVGGVFYQVSSSTAISTGQWLWVVASYDGTTLKLFLMCDETAGVLTEVGSLGIGGPVDYSAIGTNKIAVGRSDPADPNTPLLKAKMNQLFMYDTALSTVKIQEVIDGGGTFPENPVLRMASSSLTSGHADGDPVASWPSDVAPFDDFTQATGANQPTYLEEPV